MGAPSNHPFQRVFFSRHGILHHPFGGIPHFVGTWTSEYVSCEPRKHWSFGIGTADTETCCGESLIQIGWFRGTPHELETSIYCNNDHQNHLLVCPYQPSLPIMYIVEILFKTPWLTYFGISSVCVILIASPSVISHIAGTSTSWTSISEAPSCRMLFYYFMADFMFHVPILFPFSMIDPWCLYLCLCSPINLLNKNKDAHDLMMMFKKLVFPCTSNVFSLWWLQAIGCVFIKHYMCLKFKHSNFL